MSDESDNGSIGETRSFTVLSESDPLLKSIRGTERFKQLLARVKVQWEHFEV
jgi:hypothetical protein